MRFTVTHGPLNELDVKLHWKTKEKIKNTLYTVGWIAGCTAIVLGTTKKPSKETK